jgi:hypothetical protein
MPGVWTTPPTFTPGQIVTATDFNSYLRDNPLYLLARPSQSILRDNNASYTTTSTSFVDIDGTNLKITMSISGSAVLLGFTGAMILSTTGYAKFDFDVDGTRFANGGTDGLTAGNFINGNPNLITMMALVTGLAAGSHTFKPKWCVSSGAITGTLFAGNGTGGQDFLPDFWAVEVG